MPDWSAALIVPGSDFDGAPLLRRELTLDTGHGEVTAAVLHATAHGVYEAFLNGRPVSDEVLSPGWSATSGGCATAATTSPTCSSPPRCWASPWATAGGPAGSAGTAAAATTARSSGVFAQLEITFADGHVQRVVTDEDWTAGPSAVLAERPLRRPDRGRAARTPTRGCGRGSPARAGPGSAPASCDLATLTPYVGPPVRRQAEIAPVRIWTSPAGATLVDFGQNLVGWVRVRVSGPAGTEVTLRHAEVLEHDELGVRPLRSALATDHFVLSGGDGRLRAHLHLPRLPLRRGRGVAGRARPTATYRRRGVLRPGAHRRVLLLRRRCWTSCTRTPSGGPSATSSTSPPTARSATSGWAGPATSPRSRRRRRSCSTSRPSCGTGCATWRPSSRRADGHGRLRHPRRAQVRAPRTTRRPARSPTPTPPPSGATPPSGCRGRCGRPTATSRCWRTSSTRWPRTSAGSRR